MVLVLDIVLVVTRFAGVRSVLGKPTCRSADDPPERWLQVELATKSGRRNRTDSSERGVHDGYGGSREVGMIRKAGGGIVVRDGTKPRGQ